MNKQNDYSELMKDSIVTRYIADKIANEKVTHNINPVFYALGGIVTGLITFSIILAMIKFIK